MFEGSNLVVNGIKKLKAWSTAKHEYTHHNTDYKQTPGLFMLPFRSILRWFCASWDFLLYLALQPRYHYQLASSQLENHMTLKATKCDDKILFVTIIYYDLELRPTTSIYNPSLTKGKVDPQGQGSNGSEVRASADRQIVGRYQTYYLPCFTVDKYPAMLLQFAWPVTGPQVGPARPVATSTGIKIFSLKTDFRLFSNSQDYFLRSVYIWRDFYGGGWG